MRNFRLLIIALVSICLLALGAIAVANRVVQAPGDDVIIIKGGSLTVQCPPNGDTACLGVADGTGKYHAAKATAHITKLEVKDNTGKTLFTSTFDPGHPPQVEVTYK